MPDFAKHHRKVMKNIGMGTVQVASDYLRTLEKDIALMTPIVARVAPLIEMADSASNLRLAVIDASRSFYKVPAQSEQSYHVVKMERESND